MKRCQRLWLLIFLLTGLWGSVLAQPLRGLVLNNTTGQPVESAHVTLGRLPDSLIVAFARTTREGAFMLTHRLDTTRQYYISVSHVSYRTAKRPLTSPYVGWYVIDLEPGSLVLKEVQVTVHIPVRERGDSTRYKVDAFHNGSERNLEEVLRKMPNVRIEENGDIYFKEKRVEKVLLDGDNLVGDAYQLATRSVDPAVLDEVQAIEHYSENKLLQAIERSEKTILNLTVKNSRKRLLFGSLDVGAGPQRYNGIGNVFSYGKHTKAFAVVSANNTGTRRLDLTDATASVLPDNRPASEQIRPYTQTAQPFFRNLNSPLENLNNEQTSTFNWVISPAKPLKITANLSLLRDQVQGRRTQTYELLTGDVPQRYRQSDSLRQKPTLAHLRLQAEYQLSGRTALVYKGVIGAKSINLYQATQFASADTTYRSPQQFVNQIRDSRHTLELTQKLGTSHALVLSVQATDTRLIEQFSARINADLASVLLLDTSTVRRVVRQVADQQNQLYGGQLHWLYGTKRHKVEQLVGFINNQYEVALGQTSAGAEVRPYSDALDRQTLFSRTTAKLILPIIELTSTVQFNAVSTRVGPRFDRRTTTQATLMASYRLSSQSRLSVSVERQEVPAINSLVLGRPILSDFRSAQQGYQGVLFDKRSQASVGYVFSDATRRRMAFSASLFATQSSSLWGLADLSLSPDYTVARLANTPGVYTLGAGSTFEKLVYPISGNIRLSVNLMQHRTTQLVNGEQSNASTIMPTLTARYVSVFDSPFNMELGATYRQTLLLASQSDELFQQSFTVKTAYGQLMYRQQKYQFDLRADGNRIGQNNMLFMNANARYQLSAKLNLRAEILNLLNQTTYRQQSITPTTYATGIYPLLPRMSLLYVQYTF